jgi:hypothetical protein
VRGKQGDQSPIQRKMKWKPEEKNERSRRMEKMLGYRDSKGGWQKTEKRKKIKKREKNQRNERMMKGGKNEDGWKEEDTNKYESMSTRKVDAGVRQVREY